MNTKIFAGVGIGLILVLGIISMRSQQSASKEVMTPEPASVMEEKKPVDGAMMENESRYIAYSQASFDAAAGKKRVLFFHAPWCPTCRPADAAFQKDAALIPENVVLFKTDYDTSDVLKKKYRITYQHTFVQVDASGNEVAKWNGGQLDELIANVK